MIPPVIVPLTFKEILNATIDCKYKSKSHSDLEKSIATYNDSKHAIFTTSGRSSLHILLKSYGLKAGDEIAMPAYMCSSVSDMLYDIGFDINFIDINPNTYNISIEDLTEKISKSTKCILPTHMFGNVCDMKSLREITTDYNAILIEDSAQTMGSKYKDKNVGTIGDSGFFSFGRGKPLTCMQGGAIVTDDDTVARKCRAIMDKFPITDTLTDLKSFAKMIGYSSIRNRSFYNLLYKYVRNEKTRGHIGLNTVKVNNSQYHARVCVKQLNKLDEFNDAREKNVQKISSVVNSYSCIEAVRELPHTKSFYLRFPIQVDQDKRDEIMTELIKRGIETSVVYPVSLNVLYDTSSHCNNAEEIVNRTIALPTHPLMNKNDICQILNVLEQYTEG